MKALKSFDDVITLYESEDIEELYYEDLRAEFSLDIDGGYYNVFDVLLGPSWITLYAEEGTIEYAVDRFPTGNEYVLFDIKE